MKILNIGQIGLNENEPILFGSNRYVEGTDYVRQKIIQKLSVIQGELVSPIPSIRASREYGVPYLDKLNVAELDLVLKNLILSIPEVFAIVSWNSSQVGDTYTCEFSCRTTKGVLSWKI